MQLRLGYRFYSSKKDSSGCFSSSQTEKFKKLRPEASLIMHHFLGNRAKKKEYKRTPPYPHPWIKLQANQQGRNTLLGKLCSQPYLMKECLILYISADPSYCIITQEAQIFMQSLTFRTVKYSPTRETILIVMLLDLPCIFKLNTFLIGNTGSVNKTEFTDFFLLRTGKK